MSKIETVELRIEGMSCGHCVKAVKGAIASLVGVSSVEVTLEPPVAHVAYDPSLVTVEAMVAASGAEGYPASRR